MNIPTPPPDGAERTERHRQALAELMDGAIQLASDALRTALRHSAAKAAAEAAGLPPPPVARAEGPDPADAFCRLFDRVCRGIALEGKLAGRQADHGRARRRARQIEPRRTRVRDILHHAVVVDADDPRRETVRQTIEDALENDDIEQLMARGALFGDVVGEICSRYDLLVDEDRLPEDAQRRTRVFPFTHRSPTMRAVGLRELIEQGPDPP